MIGPDMESSARAAIIGSVRQIAKAFRGARAVSCLPPFERCYIRRSTFVRMAVISSLSLRRCFFSFSSTSSLVARRFLFRFDAMDTVINFIVARCEPPELIVRSSQLFYQRHFMRKLLWQFMRDAHCGKPFRSCMCSLGTCFQPFVDAFGCRTGMMAPDA